MNQDLKIYPVQPAPVPVVVLGGITLAGPVVGLGRGRGGGIRRGGAVAAQTSRVGRPPLVGAEEAEAAAGQHGGQRGRD